MSYELFSKKHLRSPGPKLLIRNGRIFLNSEASVQFNKAGTQYVHLFWDSSNSGFALKPLKKKEENSFKLSRVNGRHSLTLSASSFLRYINWKAKIPVSFQTQWDDSEHLLKISFRDEILGENLP